MSQVGSSPVLKTSVMTARVWVTSICGVHDRKRVTAGSDVSSA
jgi:hypothetical protein